MISVTKYNKTLTLRAFTFIFLKELFFLYREKT